MSHEKKDMVVWRLRAAGRSGRGPGKNSAALHHRAEQECQRRALLRPAYRRRQTGSRGAGNRLLDPARQGR